MAKQNKPAAEMPFLDHLEELRWRIFWALGALVVGVAIAFVLLQQEVGGVNIITLLQRPIKPYLNGRNLIYTSPTDPFKIVLNASFAIGLVIASPVVFYQLWAFMSPALYAHEKRLAIPVIVGAVGLFVGGVALAFYTLLPLTLGFLLTFQSGGLDPAITASGYFGFAMGMMFAFGAVCELPILIVALTALGIITPDFLNRYRRHAIVLCVVVAAFITPGGDPTSLFALTVPLYLLFEVSVVLSALVYRRRMRRQALAGAVPPGQGGVA